MGKERLTDEAVEEKRLAITKIEGYIKSLEAYKSGKDSEFWKELGGRMEAWSKVSKNKALAVLTDPDGTADRDYPKARLEAGVYRVLDLFVSDVNNAPKLIDRAREEIANLKNTLREAKENNNLVTTESHGY